MQEKTHLEANSSLVGNKKPPKSAVSNQNKKNLNIMNEM
jgi:hypothetical protein